MPKQYERYSTEEFIKDEKFILWVKYGHPEYTTLFEKVMQHYPFQNDTIKQARCIVEKLVEENNYRNNESDIKEIWNQITYAVDEYSSTPAPVKLIQWWSIASAASIILILGFTLWFFKSSPSKTIYATLVKQAQHQLLEENNVQENAKKIILPDGSEVTIGINSKISFSPEFNGSVREVYLSGSAFFNVVKNPNKPFLVYSNEIITRVLGTSFSINASEEDKNIVVSVKTGKVSVTTNNKQVNIPPLNISLLPDQQAIFSRKEHKLTMRDASFKEELHMESTEVASKFSNAPVTLIFQSLENEFDIKIKYEETTIENCRLTTSFQNETLVQKLDIICEAIGVSYQLADKQVIIKGNGCN